MTIFAVILNYKKKDITLACIESLKKCKKISDLKLKILVVDNDSGDGIERAVRTTHNDVEFLQTGANLGYTGGNNAGIRYLLEKCEEIQPEIVKDSQSEQNYFLILNNDTFFDENFLLELASATKHHSRAGIISPKIYFTAASRPSKIVNEHNDEYILQANEEVLWYAGGTFDWDNIIGGGRGVDQVDHGQYNQEEQIEIATGCAMLIPFAVMKQVHGFDHKYFMYYEDVDLSVRIKKLGYELWYIPKAVLWHENSASSGSGSPLHEYFQMRNRLLFAFKFAKLRTKLAVLREGFRMRTNAARWKGVKDFLMLKFEKGSFEIK